MAIAIVPQSQKNNLSSNREGWLTMAQADELICKHLGVEPDPEKYYMGWFDSFFYFDWYSTRGIRPSSCDYAFPFLWKGQAKRHYLCKQIMGEEEYTHESVEHSISYVENCIFPIIDAIYEEGYMIVSLNIG